MILIRKIPAGSDSDGDCLFCVVLRLCLDHRAHDEEHDEQPHSDDRNRVIPALRLAVLPHALGLRAARRHHLRRNEPHGERDHRGQDDEVVEIPQHGDEIGDQVDGRERITYRQRREHLRSPRRLLSLEREKHGGDIGLELFGAIFQRHRCFLQTSFFLLYTRTGLAAYHAITFLLRSLINMDRAGGWYPPLQLLIQVVLQRGAN